MRRAFVLFALLVGLAGAAAPARAAGVSYVIQYHGQWVRVLPKQTTGSQTVYVAGHPHAYAYSICAQYSGPSGPVVDALNLTVKLGGGDCVNVYAKSYTGAGLTVSAQISSSQITVTWP